MTKGVPPGCIPNTGMLPEHTAGQHASSHSPSRGSTHDVPERRLANTGTGTVVHCKCAPKSRQGILFSAGLAVRAPAQHRASSSRGSILRRLPTWEMRASHPQEPSAPRASARQRPSRADTRPRLAVPELQQSASIPVRAASLNYRGVDLPVEHLAELDSMNGEVMCHAAHNISCRLLSD